MNELQFVYDTTKTNTSISDHWPLNEMSEHHSAWHRSWVGKGYVVHVCGLHLCFCLNPAQVEGFSQSKPILRPSNLLTEIPNE